MNEEYTRKEFSNDITYINIEQALKIIKKILSECAFELEEDDYILIEDDGIIIGKDDDFDEDSFCLAIPAEDVVIFKNENEFYIKDEQLIKAIKDLQ